MSYSTFGLEYNVNESIKWQIQEKEEKYIDLYEAMKKQRMAKFMNS